MFRKHQNIWNLHETHELQGGEDLSESMNLSPSDPPKNVRRQQDLHDSNYEVFHAKGPNAFWYFVEYFLNRRWCRRIFHSAVQFSYWYKRFWCSHGRGGGSCLRNWEVRDGADGVDVQPWLKLVTTRPMVIVSTANKCGGTSGSDLAYRKSLKFILARGCYEAPGNKNSIMLRCWNHMSNDLHLPKDELIFLTDPSASGSKALHNS